MPLPGDEAITRLFGFPGFEALLRVNLKYINELREEQGNPALTYEEYRGEIEVMTESISNQTP